MSPRRPFLEVLAGAVLRRPYDDAEGRKGPLGLLARAQRHVVRNYELKLPGWPKVSRPLRIAFLSDFHVGSLPNLFELLPEGRGFRGIPLTT